jgi:hypothetical protein
VIAKSGVAKGVLDHHDGSVHDHAEVERAQRKQVCGNLAKIEENGRE